MILDTSRIFRLALAYVAGLSCILLLLFLVAQTLCIATQNVFYQIKKQEEIKKKNFMIFITL